MLVPCFSCKFPGNPSLPGWLFYRYLEGIARHGGKAALDAKAAVAKLRGLAMVAAEAVATKFEHEAQLRVGATVQQQTLLSPPRSSHKSAV